MADSYACWHRIGGTFVFRRTVSQMKSRLLGVSPIHNKQGRYVLLLNKIIDMVNGDLIKMEDGLQSISEAHIDHLSELLGYSIGP